MFLPANASLKYKIVLFIALAAIIVMGLLSWFMKNRSIKNIYYLFALVVCTGIGLGIFYMADTELFSSVAGMFAKVNRSGVKLTTLEAQPLLFPGGEFSISVAWANFTTGLVLSLISLGLIFYSLFKDYKADRMLLFVWSLVILIVTLSMRRFAYYYSVNVALLTGYIAWLILGLMGFKEPGKADMEEPDRQTKKAKRKKQKNITSARAKGWNIKTAGIIIVVILVFYPNIGPLPRIGPFPAGSKPAIDTAKTIPYIPDDAWCAACDWLRENTAEPFDDPDYYYANYESDIQTDESIPEAAYSVAAWWDYGYLITRMAHRVPVCNPGGGERERTAKLFTANSLDKAGKRSGNLKTQYIMLDFDTTTVKFYAVVDYANLEESTYFDMYFKDEGDGLMRGDYYFHPAYYESLAVRLYNFNGRDVIPETVTVISYENRSYKGEAYKYITSLQEFSDYPMAKEFIENQQSGNYRIVGTNPFASPVPLDASEQYKPVYSSEQTKKYADVIVPQVKIFEYLGTR
jgi:dolichyl-diphosphooligosaccharide--protein glycosyltransferase